ncbi:MAG: hypothetical protein EPN17_11000 [Methylobacter sp.]|nr:MAG: hypothetical protein EPN17_11000 [Methylobacter sp.]
MSRIPYDASKESLYQPGNAKDFFCSDWDLNLSDHNILCAEMARLAYVTQQDALKTYLVQADFELHGTLGYETKGTQVFIAKPRPGSAHSALIVAFRGTEGKDPLDLIADVRFLKTPWKDVNGNKLGQVHQGFAKALLVDNEEGNFLTSIQKILEPLINDYQTLLITGHSLGAALATLTAAYFQPMPWAEKIHLFTFGSPLVGDKEFSDHMGSIKHKRFVNCCDLVTRVPKWFGYMHSGELNYIDKEGNRSTTNKDNGEISEDRKAARKQYRETYDWWNKDTAVITRDFSDHTPINYLSGITGLRRKTLQSFSFDEIKRDELKKIQEIRSEADETNLVGLAFSGGGIRSATFGLGVLEALKEKRILEKVDYLSTVSGGGYIGSWLSANCARHGNNWSKMPTGKNKIEECKDWQESVGYLRRYSNYLSPNIGFLSVDTWSMLTTWLRNTLLVQLMVIIGIATVLLLPRTLLPLLSLPIENLLSITFVFVIWIFFSLHQVKPKNIYKHPITAFLERISFIKNIRIPRLAVFFIAMLVLIGFYSLMWSEFSLIWPQGKNDPTYGYGKTITKLLPPLYTNENFKWRQIHSVLVISYLSFAAFSFVSSRGNIVGIKNIHHFLVAIPASIVLHLLFSAIVYKIGDWKGFVGGEILAFTWVPPMIACSLALAINVLIGIQGIDSYEVIREWWSRFGAWLAIYGTAWMLIVVTSFYGPLWAEILYYEESWKTIGSGWIGTTIAGLLAGKSASTNGTDGNTFSIKIKQTLAKGAPFIFIFGLVVIVSWAVHLVIAVNSNNLNISKEGLLGKGSPIIEAQQIHSQIDACSFNNVLPVCIAKDGEIKYTLEPGYYNKDTKEYFDTNQLADKNKQHSPYDKHWELITTSSQPLVTGMLILSWLIGLILSRRIDINEFSLNAFYRDRLARCYLGASNDKREPHPFTGFDEQDDINLSSLGGNNKNPPCRPFHILNCALNLGGSSDLSLHTRHSAVFTLTPLYCGSAYVPKGGNGKPIENAPDGKPQQIGYRPTANYCGTEHQPTLGQAVSVSGAAASPNMGYHTSLPVAFLMTLFNARLGWWFPNPNKNLWENPSPMWSLKYLRYELFGTANETDDFLAISDGGHFENLAAYELIKRRCKVIIISDGECDPKLQFEGLANLTRLSDVDLDATINIDIRAIQPVGDEKWSRSRCSVGKIHYRKTERFPDDPVDGWLIYIKAAMNGHEGTSVMQYKATHPDFPHETTGNQFYTEDQFESYRSLGRDITEKLFGKIDDLDGLTMQCIACKLNTIFSPTLPNQSQFTHHADKLMEIWDQLREDDDLKDLDHELGLPSTGPAREIFYKCSEMIQLMENVYLDLNLEDTWDHPDNKGWMELFKNWATSQQLSKTWGLTKKTYGIRFQSFWDRKLINKPNINYL